MIVDSLKSHRDLLVNMRGQWQPVEALATKMERLVATTLLDLGSLTQRLTEEAGGQFDIVNVSEQRVCFSESECQALGISAGSLGWGREVYLTGRGIPWVFARTLIPEQVQKNVGMDFRSLGNQSIGRWLFGELNFKRGSTYLYRYQEARGSNQPTSDPYWMRRSCFERGESKILVSEVFLSTYWESVRQATGVI